MPKSLFPGFLCIYLLSLFCPPVTTSTVQHDFDIAWIWADPSGTHARPVIGVNGQWPPPTIKATVGDVVVINVHNSLGNQSTSLHFHGLFMNGSSHMDGTSYVSQCAIEPGARFTYNFTVQQPGTYWYHSHSKSQYPDGLRGLLIINDPASPYREQYDEEIIISLSDWYHTQTPDLLKLYGAMRDPSPDANLINDAADAKVHIQAGKTYLVRIANIGAFIGQYFWIENHVMKVVEVDGVYTDPVETNMLFVGTGQRYAFLLTIEEGLEANVPMITRMDESSFPMHSVRPESIDGKAWLTIDPELSFPDAQSPKGLHALNDMSLVPLDHEPLLEAVDQSINLTIDMHTQTDGVSHWLFNTEPYTTPDNTPSLFAALAAGSNATSPNTYTHQTQPYILSHNAVIEVIMKNKHMRPHPVHLHGHNFQVIHRSGKGTIEDTPAGTSPLRRDTVVINNHGTLRIRFRADNPGVWLFHCHMEWHSHSGLVATFVEAPLELQAQMGDKLMIGPNPERACDAPERIYKLNQNADSAAGAEAQRASRTLLGIPLTILALGASITLIGAAIFYIWYRSKGSRQRNTSYSLVPIVDEDRIYEQDDGEIDSK